jgi:cytochrome c-type biogenesis protein CcmE
LPTGVNPRTKFLLGFLLVIGSAGYLMASSIRDTGMYYFTPSELAAKVASDPGFRDVGLKVGARVVPGSIVRDESGREVRFLATDGAKTFPVLHRGTIPDTFSDSADVIVEGRLDAAGTFQSTILLAKCASRFEAAPDKYRDTPGYQAAAPKRTS